MKVFADITRLDQRYDRAESRGIDVGEYLFSDVAPFVWCVEVFFEAWDFVTYATEEKLVSLMDGGYLDGRFSLVGERCDDGQYGVFAVACEMVGIRLPANEGDRDCGNVKIASVFSAGREESCALAEARGYFFFAIAHLRDEGVVRLNHASATSESRWAQVQKYCSWARARISAALSSGAPLKNFFTTEEIQSVRSDNDSPDGRRAGSSWKERSSTIFFARVPTDLARIPASGDMEEVAKGLISYFDQAEEEILVAFCEDRVKE